MSYKEFDAEEHMSCPRCGFEAVYANGRKAVYANGRKAAYANGRKAAYVYKSGVVDSQSVTNDNDYCDGEKLLCNSIHCDWEMSF